MLDKIDIWVDSIKQVQQDKDLHPGITRVFKEVLRFVIEKEWIGGCHAISAVLHILLSEAGATPELCIGEVWREKTVFDHSWIEIDGSKYDVAVVYTLDGQVAPPVFADIDLDTLQPTRLEYGVPSGFETDDPATMIQKIPFEVYMDNFPGHQDGLWGFVLDIGRSAGMKLRYIKIKKKYKNTEWQKRGA